MSKKKIVLVVLIIAIVIVVFKAISENRKTLINVNMNKQKLPITTKEKNPNNYTSVTSLDNIEVPVPTGFVASSVEEERYVNIQKDEEGNKIHEGGFVIYEGAEPVPTDESELLEAQMSRNQYVWVPISSEECGKMYNANGYAGQYNVNSSKSGYTYVSNGTSEPALIKTDFDSQTNRLTSYLNGMSRFDFLDEMKIKFKEMIESVATYGGFYVGRYEMGNVNSNLPVVQKLNTDLCLNSRKGNYYTNWYKYYEKCKRLRGNLDSVDTYMIWGIQWDEIMKWFTDTEVKTASEIWKNSSSWGNYSDATFLYLKQNLTTDRKTTAITIPSGSADYCKANNIYDLAGNMWECTMESTSKGTRYLVGGWKGRTGSDEPVCTVYDGYNPGYSDDNHGCRATLYIK